MLTQSVRLETGLNNRDFMSHGNRLVILTGNDSPLTCASIESICDHVNGTVLGIVLDRNIRSRKQKLNGLMRNIHREGLSYIGFRFVEMIDGILNALATRIVPSPAVERLLSLAFADRVWTLAELSKSRNIPLYLVDNLNAPDTEALIRSIDADLGVVLGTRILKRSAFATPRLGSLNVHKGKVPEFRGMPPAFWEMYEKQKTAGVTIHFVDAGLDTGDIVAEDAVPIDPRDTPTTLRRKLDRCANRLLPVAINSVLSGTLTRIPQQKGGRKPRTKPTRAETQVLYQRLGLRPPIHSIAQTLKTALYAGIYYSGMWRGTRLIRRLFKPFRAAVLLYHRVNDECDDHLTTSRTRFAEHLLVLKKYYNVISSRELVQCLESRQLPHDAVCIHFDDSYEDVYGNAAPLLHGADVPACAFISSGFMDSDRRFAHDIEKYPLHLQNLTTAKVKRLHEKGIAIGSHTVNHQDMGSCDLSTAIHELTESKRSLEVSAGYPVTQFSFPFGWPNNSRPDLDKLAANAGYDSVFSAYGGFVDSRTSRWNIPRFGVDDSFRPLDLLMEIEGLSLGSLKRRFVSRSSEVAAKVSFGNLEPTDK